MVATSAAVASTAERPGGILATQNILGDPSLAEVILPGKTKSPADYAYARWMQGGIEHGSALHGVLMQMLTGTDFSADRGMADVTGTDTVANNEGDAANGATVAKNPIQPSWYGTDVSYPKDETAEEVSTPLGGASRVLSQQDAKVGPNGSPPVGALDSFYNREVVPTPTYAEGAAGQTVADDLDPEVIDNPGGHSMSSPGQPRAGIAVTSGGMYSAYGFNHFYGRNRNNTQPRGDDGINGPVSNIDQYLAAMYGAEVMATMQPRGETSAKIDNPGGHRSEGTGQPR